MTVLFSAVEHWRVWRDPLMWPGLDVDGGVVAYPNRRSTLSVLCTQLCTP